MRSEDIRIANGKFYYCEDYIWSFKRLDKYIPYIFVILTQVILWKVRGLILERKYITEAASQNLGMIDVRQWVDSKLAENQIDVGVVIILLFSVIICSLLFLRTFNIIKSYKLYKWGGLRAALVIAYILEFGLILVNYKLENCGLGLLVTVILDIAPILFSSRLLYPLESRPKVKDKGTIDITILFDFLAKVVIKKL